MREIKFRAWDRKRNEWYGKTAGLTFYGFALWGECTLIEPPHIADLQHLLVDQYTGLKDKNGVEIYESDIIQYLCGYGYAEVVWNEKNACFETSDKEVLSSMLEGDGLRVIGNIHQSPELLKDGS